MYRTRILSLTALILLASVAIELVYVKLFRFGGQQLFHNSAIIETLVRSRSLILTPFYVLLLLFAIRVLKDDLADRMLSWALLLGGLLLGLIFANPFWFFGGLMPDPLRDASMALSTSQFALSIHVSALIAAAGILRLISKQS